MSCFLSYLLALSTQPGTKTLQRLAGGSRGRKVSAGAFCHCCSTSYTGPVSSSHSDTLASALTYHHLGGSTRAPWAPGLCRHWCPRPAFLRGSSPSKVAGTAKGLGAPGGPCHVTGTGAGGPSAL